MNQHIKALEAYLADVVKLDRLQFTVTVVEGRLDNRFHEQAWFETGKDAQGEVRYQPIGQQAHMQMTLKYQLQLHIQQYGGDVVTLLALVSHWLYQTFSQHLLHFDGPQPNNQQTVDLWMDMDVSEVWHNKDGEWVSCEC